MSQDTLKNAVFEHLMRSFSAHQATALTALMQISDSGSAVDAVTFRGRAGMGEVKGGSPLPRPVYV